MDRKTNETKVFVYGTLRKGESNNRLLEEAKFLGKAKWETIDYELKSLGFFPAMVKKYDKEKFVVIGEVYEVDNETLKRLNKLEGVPTFYQIIEREFTLLDNKKVEEKKEKGIVYVIDSNRYFSYENDIVTGEKEGVKIGDWVKFRKKVIGGVYGKWDE